MLGSRIGRGLASGAALTSVLIALVGLAHTPVGRPLLRALGRVAHGGCPLGYDAAQSPADRERARAAFARGHRGSAPAAQRPALGFKLDHSTRGEVERWMATNGVTCQHATALADLVCSKVQSQLLPSEFTDVPSRELWFNFGAGERLIALTALSHQAAAAPASRAFSQVVTGVEQAAGPAARASGDASSAELSAGALRQASAEFRFSDYYALARVTNLGDGFLLSEEYRSLPD